MLIFLNQGEKIALDYLTNKDSPQNLVLRLFQNDVKSGLNAAQIDALDETDLTEADFAGYSAQTLTGANWTSTGGDPSDTEYAEQTVTSSSDQTPQTIYGYYYTRASGGEATAFEYFNSPVTVQFANDAIKVTPKITAQDTQD